jgi:hypothetical protein
MADMISSPEKPVTVIHLTTHMTLAPSTELYITCDSAIEIESRPPVYISSACPILIKASAKASAKISPSCSLGPDFAKGWQKLPTELKMHVLSFNLVLDTYVEYGTTLPAVQQVLYAHLAMGPEIAGLSLSVFYKSNRFVFSRIFTDEHDDGDPVYLAPRAYCSFIKNIHLRPYLNGRDWELMQFVLQDWKTFPNLQFIHVHFRWQTNCLNTFLRSFKTDGMEDEVVWLNKEKHKLHITFQEDLPDLSWTTRDEWLLDLGYTMDSLRERMYGMFKFGDDAIARDSR